MTSEGKAAKCKKRFQILVLQQYGRKQHGGEKSESYGMFFLEGNILLERKKIVQDK